MIEAKLVFDTIELPDVVSWNTLIAGYADKGQDNFTSLVLFANMQNKGCSPDSRTFVLVLKACSRLAEKEDGDDLNGEVVKTRSLEKGMAVHSEAQRSSVDRSLYVGTSLVDMYMKSGSLEDARRAFEGMVERNVVSWTVLVSGYAEQGDERVALELFTLMQLQGCEADSVAVVAALSACSSLAMSETERKMVTLETVMEIHALAMRKNFCRDVYVGSCLVDVYVKLGTTEEARRVFDDIPDQDVVTWTTLLRGYVENGQPQLALKMFSSMTAEGCAPNSQTFSSVLKACSTSAASEPAAELDGQLVKLYNLELAVALHSEAVKRNVHLDTHVGCSLVDVYGKCGMMQLANDVFQRLADRNSASWNALLLGYVENGEELKALRLLESMQEEGVPPDDRTFTCMLKACSSLAVKQSTKKLTWLEAGMSLHSQALLGGCTLNVYLTASLIDMYFNCGSLEDARAVFDASPSKDSAVWTAVILGYAENSRGEEALELFTSMEAAGCRRDTRMFAAALKACTCSNATLEGEAVHGEICRLGAERDPVMVTSLLDFYGKCGHVQHAQVVFDSAHVGSLSTVTWNSLLTGHTHKGNVQTFFDLMEEMVARGFKVDGVTFVLVLTLCSHAGLVERGRECFKSMKVKHGVEAGIEHYHCMIDMLGRGNRVEEAVEMVEEMPFKANVVTWTTLLGACRLWRNVDIGRVAFERLQLVALEREKGAAYVLLSNTFM